MTEPRAIESLGERLAAALMQFGFWSAFACIALGLAIWIQSHGSDRAGLLLACGLIGLMLLPTLRLLFAIAAAQRRRDWVTLASTLAVLAILLALTLRDAAKLR